MWCHGDWAELTEHGGMIIYGRSDATLNPAACASARPRSIGRSNSSTRWRSAWSVGQEWDSDVRIVLFVKLRDGLTLDDALRDKIRETIRRNLTPRHVPAKVIQVPDIPRTRNGKIDGVGGAQPDPRPSRSKTARRRRIPRRWIFSPIFLS